MNRIPVESSMISSVGYDYENKILEIEFKRGSIYHYFDVPESRYSGLMDASSKGAYMNQSIIRKYQHSLVDEPKTVTGRRRKKTSA